jgi:intracellular septation protein A
MDFLFILIPLLAYVIVEWKYGYKAGVYTAIGGLVVTGLWFYFRYNDLDELLLVEGSLLIGMGLISLKLQDSTYFKLQPTVMAGLLMAYLGIYQIMGDPVMVRYIPLLTKMDPAKQVLFESEAFRVLATHLSRDFIFVFFAHGLLMLYAAKRWTTPQWMMCRLLIYPMALVVMIIEQLIWLQP